MCSLSRSLYSLMALTCTHGNGMALAWHGIGTDAVESMYRILDSPLQASSSVAHSVLLLSAFGSACSAASQLSHTSPPMSSLSSSQLPGTTRQNPGWPVWWTLQGPPLGSLYAQVPL